MTRMPLGCIACVALLFGCDVASVQQAPSSIAQNQCDSSSQCGVGQCADGQCLARKGSFDTLLFEVSPPANATPSAGLQFLLRQQGLSLSGGELPLSLQPVSQLVGEVTLLDRKCTPTFDDDGVLLAGGAHATIPASITITPTERVLGVSTPPAIVQTSLVNNSYYSFSANVPPGSYEIYVQPQHHDSSCIVPPQLVRAQVFAGNTVQVGFNLPEPSVFELHVTWPPADGALSHWFVDMLDPSSGKVISNSAPLALGTGGKTDYVASVSYLPVVNDTADTSAQDLLRLSPPEGTDAPTILLARSALGLFDANSGRLNQFTSLPPVVEVHGQVNALSTPQPVAATVTFVATAITGIVPGVLASYVRTATVGADGQFVVNLLPGHYRVLAVPSVALNGQDQSGLGAKLAEVRIDDWQVGASPKVQAGKVIELGQALPINGQALDSSGAAVATALVEAVASTTAIQHDVLLEALGAASSIPRASTGTVLGSGDFALLADPGVFDVSVRPQASTGFAWSVVPNVNVGTAGENTAGVTLNSPSPLPVLYRGTVTVPGDKAPTAVPGALIRAYVYTSKGTYTSDYDSADSTVQIAETRADDGGDFRLFIPAALNSVSE